MFATVVKQDLRPNEGFSHMHAVPYIVIFVYDVWCEAMQLYI